MKFYGFRLLVNDFKKSVEFYRDVLQLPVEWNLEDAGYANFNLGSTNLEIFSKKVMAEAINETDSLTKMPSSLSVVLDFGVDNVDETYEEMCNKGVLFINKPHDRSDWGARVAHFRDPDGYLIEIYTSLGMEKEGE